jgi:hypothetical protein
MSLILKSGTAGTITIDATNTASNFTINLPASNGVLIASGSGNTGGMILPSGTTAQRTVAPSTGRIRYNSELGYIEFYNGVSWSKL